MGSWRRMGAFLGLVPGEDGRDEEFAYPYEGEASRHEPREASEAEWQSRPHGGPVRRGEARRATSTGFDEPMTQGALAMAVRPEPRPTGESVTSGRPLTVKLTGFAEARIIGERYREGASVILDMTDLTDADARRVVDFAAGLAFAMRGSIDKVTTRVFMLLPPDVDLSAEDRRAYAGSYVGR